MKKKPLSRVLPLLVLTAALATGGMALYLINPIALGGRSSNYTLTLSKQKNASFPYVSGQGYAAYPDTALASGDTSYPVYFEAYGVGVASENKPWGISNRFGAGADPYLANLSPFTGLVSLQFDVVFGLLIGETISKAVTLPVVTFSKTSDYATTVSGSGSFGAASSWDGGVLNSLYPGGAVYSGTFSVPTNGIYDYVQVSFPKDAWILSMVYTYSCAEAVVATSSNTSSENGATAETSGTAGSGLVVTSIPTTSHSSYPSL